MAFRLRSGTEDIGAEDAFDGDDGRLLDGVEQRVEGMASLPPASWNLIIVWLKQIEALREAA